MTAPKSGYPEVLQQQLPEAKVAFQGARGWLLQAPNSQLLFFEFEKDTKPPRTQPHLPTMGRSIRRRNGTTPRQQTSPLQNRRRIRHSARSDAWRQILQAHKGYGFLSRKRPIQTQITLPSQCASEKTCSLPVSKP